ncbi:MAG: hypothetical protein AAFQ52_05005, partial [Chloroflexota bacterium]
LTRRLLDSLAGHSQSIEHLGDNTMTIENKALHVIFGTGPVGLAIMDELLIVSVLPDYLTRRLLDFR